MTLLTLSQAHCAREQLRSQKQRLVFTNGHFELLHLGHLRYLESARALGDALFVGVNGDQSTLHLKGRGSVLVPALERATLIAAWKPVSAAIIFEEDTACQLIEALQPDIYVKGGDYAATVTGNPAKPLPERAVVESYGGRVLFVDYLANYSTSSLFSRIQALKSVSE